MRLVSIAPNRSLNRPAVRCGGRNAPAQVTFKSRPGSDSLDRSVPANMVKEVPMIPTDDRSVICPLLSPVSFCMCVAIVLNAF